MNAISSKLNLDQLEETFEDQDPFDSAVQVKHQDSLQLSPSRTSKNSKQSNNVRCSFGLNSQQKLNPQRLHFSNQTSVSNSITSSQKKIHDTAQFPKHKKFLKREDPDCQQIQELSVEQEQSVNYSRDFRLPKKQNLTIQTED